MLFESSRPKPQSAVRIFPLSERHMRLLPAFLTRLSMFASKTPAVAGVLLIGLHYTAFRDAIREDSRHTTPSRGVTPRKKFAIEANVESRAKRQDDVRALPEAYGASRLAPRTALVPASDQQSTTTA